MDRYIQQMHKNLMRMILNPTWRNECSLFISYIIPLSHLVIQFPEIYIKLPILSFNTGGQLRTTSYPAGGKGPGPGPGGPPGGGGGAGAPVSKLVFSSCLRPQDLPSAVAELPLLLLLLRLLLFSCLALNKYTYATANKARKPATRPTTIPTIAPVAIPGVWTLVLEEVEGTE